MTDNEFLKYGNDAVKALSVGNKQAFFEAIGVLRYHYKYDYVNFLLVTYYYRENDFILCLKYVEKLALCTNDDLKPMFTAAYWDYKICCLAELKNFDEIRALFFDPEGLFDENDEVVMNYYSYFFTKYLAIKSGYEKNEPGIFRPEAFYDNPIREENPFCSILYRELCRDILDIYLNSEKLGALKRANIDKKVYRELKADIVDKISNITLLFDTKYFRFPENVVLRAKRIKDCVEHDKALEVEDATGMISLFLQEMIKTDIKNWVLAVDIFSTFEEPKVFVEMFQQYENDITLFMEANNQSVARKILGIIRNRKFADCEVNGMKFEEYWKEKVEEYFPDMTKTLKVYSYNECVFSRLSESGKWAYETALWQYENIVENAHDLMDAGLMSLSFMRILELELNNKIVKPVRGIILEKKGKDFFQGTNDDYLLGESFRGAELGRLRYFFRAVREQYDERYKYVFDIFVEEILTDAGKDLLLSGGFEDILSQSIIEKYRNPPAHSRFLHRRRAVEAKQYVEEKLMIILDCLK